MKQIELKTVTLANGAPFDYREVLTEILRIAPRQGLDLVEMEKALSIIGAVKRANGVVKLSDDEQQYLWERVREHRWGIADVAILNFSNEIREAAPESGPQDA